ncbi:MAG: Uma2 family endonuclease [Alphaproteobacteria bacterium]|nr:Uma2 family endonuclease [Alphaproteobacteria bacterium]MCB9794264.1 Uma2 family endonuclease [Alphaproteobacteria bacterium]
MPEPQPRRRRFTADEVLRMVEVGIIEEDEPIELLDGELVEMSPDGVHHVNVVRRLTRLLTSAYPPEFGIQPQCSLAAGRYDLPEPDFAVVREEGLPEDALPSAAHTVLIIEIAVTSQRRDRWKAGLYARAGAPEYWILDVPARTLSVYKRPVEGEYTRVEVLREGDAVQAPELTEPWPLATLLP